jgi:3'-phosphoadenosine 5'-phosphosulfate sulfotransferase (PAPS reductase)/FAD synthetase
MHTTCRYGEDYWMEDIDQYDMMCKVEPLQRALKESDTDAWINGRRRDHGFERAALPVWEGTKVPTIAYYYDIL